jgi:RecG-like helicase
VLGARQSGLHAFRVATLPDDLELLECAWMRARTFLDEDPALGARLRKRCSRNALAAAHGPKALVPFPA